MRAQALVLGHVDRHRGKIIQEGGAAQGAAAHTQSCLASSRTPICRSSIRVRKTNAGILHQLPEIHPASAVIEGIPRSKVYSTSTSFISADGRIFFSQMAKASFSRRWFSSTVFLSSSVAALSTRHKGRLQSSSTSWLGVASDRTPPLGRFPQSHSCPCPLTGSKSYTFPTFLKRTPITSVIFPPLGPGKEQLAASGSQSPAHGGHRSVPLDAGPRAPHIHTRTKSSLPRPFPRANASRPTQASSQKRATSSRIQAPCFHTGGEHFHSPWCKAARKRRATALPLPSAPSRS